MKRISFLAMFLAVLALLSTSCGTSDYVQSVQLTATSSAVSGGLFNLAGWGGTLQLQTNAIYHSGRIVDVTSASTFAVTADGNNDLGAALQAPPNTVVTNSTGMMTAVDPTECTWLDLTPTASTPNWALSGSYKVIATYKGMASQPVFVAVASAASATNPKGACGP